MPVPGGFSCATGREPALPARLDLMYSILLLLLAAVAAAVAARGVLAWRQSGSTLLLFCVAALAAVVLEILAAGLGRWLGAGRQLRGLYAFPLLIGTFALPLSLFTLATLSRRLGYAWARIDWGHGAVCLFAVALLIYSLPDILKLGLLFPACWQDVVWYARAVPAVLACPGEPTPGGAAAQPVVLVAVVLAYLALGVGLWRAQRWPWLLPPTLAGGVLMLAPATWGPVPYLLGKALCFGAIAWTVMHFLPILATPPPAPEDDQDSQAAS